MFNDAKNSMAIGAGLGIVFGAAFGNPGIGLVVGACLGVAFGVVIDRAKKD